MAAPLTIDALTNLSAAQGKALELAAQTLPSEWEVTVDAEDEEYAGDRFTVRIRGQGFAMVSGFARWTHPDQLAAFVERTRRGRLNRR